MQILKNIVAKMCAHGEQMKKVTTTMNDFKSTIESDGDPKEIKKELTVSFTLTYIEIYSVELNALI